MKFIYASDIHGDICKYNELYNVAINKNIKYMVWGGDLLPKKGGHRTEIQPLFIKGFFQNYLDKLNDKKIELFFIMGNDDLEILDNEIEKLCKKYSNVHNIDRNKIDVEDCCFIGLSNVLDNPFKYKNRVVMEEGLEMEKQLSQEIIINRGKDIISAEEWKQYRQTSLERMEDILENLPKNEKNSKTIYVLHDPPYGIGLDECTGGYKAGSKSIKNYLEESNAYMSLHGHIHESPEVSGKWYNKLNGTICIQPGQTELGEEKMMYMIINTDDNTQERYVKKII